MKKIIILLFLSFLLGCEDQNIEDQPVQLQPISLLKVYPGDISDVNKVEIIDGSSGERKLITDNRTIQNWLNQIKDIELIPEEKQDLVVGNIFRIALYEGDVFKFDFNSSTINNNNYKDNEKFIEPIRTFFKEQFGREF